MWGMQRWLQLQPKQKEGGQTAPVPGGVAEGRPRCCPAKLSHGAVAAHWAPLLPEDDGLKVITDTKPALEILLVTVPQPSASGLTPSWSYPSPPLAPAPASLRAWLRAHGIGMAVSPKHPEAMQRIHWLPPRFIPAAAGIPPLPELSQATPKAWADLHSLAALGASPCSRLLHLSLAEWGGTHSGI